MRPRARRLADQLVRLAEKYVGPLSAEQAAIAYQMAAEEIARRKARKRR